MQPFTEKGTFVPGGKFCEKARFFMWDGEIGICVFERGHSVIPNDGVRVVEFIFVFIGGLCQRFLPTILCLKRGRLKF